MYRDERSKVNIVSVEEGEEDQMTESEIKVCALKCTRPPLCFKTPDFSY